MTQPIIALLILERDKLSKAIEVLQGGKRRGRPPKNPYSLQALLRAQSKPARKKKRKVTAAQE
jgi:hypothetical protein